MKNKLKGTYRVKWSHGVTGDIISKAEFVYSRIDFLKLRFTDVCETIIGGITAKGHIPTIEQMEMHDGVTICERFPNSVIVKFHWVWVERED